MKWENEQESTVFYRGFGQEFILDIEKNPNVKKWAINLIKNMDKDEINFYLL